jgi:hypothetical protein
MNANTTILRPRTRNEAQWPDEPYKGLNFFTSRDAPLFSQRDDETEDCAATVDDFATRLVLVHGSSGIGKSSFLRAGLVPRLEDPQEEGCRFFFLREVCGNGEPVLVRCTDDPVARIHDVLVTAARTDERIPDHARAKMLEALVDGPALDRRIAAEAILAALRSLTAELRDIFVLLVDQAEEIITLPAESDGQNPRIAFFQLLEGICHTRADMRAVVALRTEYYGQFCSFFRIRPTTSLSSAAQPRAGLVDFLLRGLRDPERIAAAIRWPTLHDPVGRLSGPFHKYGFEYDSGVPEQIAKDLARAVGDASTLPVMQIVCRRLHERVVMEDRRQLITIDDYRDMGGVQGALDAYIACAIRGALRAAGQPDVSEVDIDRWRLVLASLAARQEGGAITTLIAGEDRLLDAAKQANLEGAVAALPTMAKSEWRVLRSMSRPGARGRAYSLGHDSVAMALLRWQEKNAERQAAAVCLEQERRQAEERLNQARRQAEYHLARQKRISRRRLGGVALGTVVVALATWLLALNTYVPRVQTVKILNAVAGQDPSNSFRLRLLLLTASLKQSDGLWSWAIPQTKARTELIEVLVRSPVFGGQFPAGLNAAGDRLVRLEGDRVIVRDLRDGLDFSSYRFERLPDSIQQPQSATSGRPTLGLVQLHDKTGALLRNQAGAVREEPVIYSDGSLTTWMNGISTLAPVISQGQAPKKDGVELPRGFQTTTTWPPFVEVAGGTLRFVSWGMHQGIVANVTVAEFKAEQSDGGFAFRPIEQKHELDWKPESRAARRIPVLAEGCGAMYAFLGSNPEMTKRVAWLGRLDAPPILQKQDLEGGVVNRNDPFPQSLAVTRKCEALVIRDTPKSLQVLSLAQGEQVLFSKDASPTFIALPESAQDFSSASFPQVTPLLAAVSSVVGTGRNVLRAAWLVPKGVAVVDAPTDAPTQASSSIYLTGLDGPTGTGRLTFSLDGAFLTLQPRGFGSAPPQVRVFDLRTAERRAHLESLGNDPIALRAEACRVADFDPAGKWLKPHELTAYLGSAEAEQPCAN